MQPDEAKIGFSGVYCIHRNSLLTPVETIDTGYGPSGMAVDPPGRFVYALNSSNDVSIYAIDTYRGTLTSAGEVTAGVGPPHPWKQPEPLSSEKTVHMDGLTRWFY